MHVTSRQVDMVQLALAKISVRAGAGATVMGDDEKGAAFFHRQAAAINTSRALAAAAKSYRRVERQ